MISPVLLNQRISQSTHVIEGRVIDQKSFWDPSHSNIYTSNLVETYKTFKNTATTYIEVVTEGGIVGNDKSVVEPSLELSVGDVGVFTLNSKALPNQFGKPVYEAFAGPQGFIKYNVEENVANEPFHKYTNLSSNLYSEIQLHTQLNYSVVKNVNPFFVAPANMSNSTQGVSAIVSFSPTTITAGTFSVLTINGSGFGATRGTSFVEFKRADDGGATFCRPDVLSYLSWSDTQIQVRVTTTGAGTVNSTPGTGVIRVDVGGVKSTSTGTLTVPYAHLNVYSSGSAPITIYNTRHVNKQAGGYMWQMFTGFDANASAKASFLRAFQSWRCGTYINWTTGPTTTVNAAANDGVNIIRFDVGSELPAGVLGRCTNWFSGCGAQPNQTWFVNELDIVFDDATTWNYGPGAPTFSQYDFESVAVHELGHGHELGHVINSAEIMNYSISNGQQKRTLSVNDLAGGNAVMTRNLSGGACAIPAMTALTASNCALGAPTASFTSNKTTVCAGQTVAFTNLSTGSPTANAWVFAGGTPSTSSVTNPTITYNTPGTYSVSLTATNSNGSNTYSVIGYITVSSPATLPLTQDFQTGVFPPTNWSLVDGGADAVKWQLSTSAGQASTQSAVFDNFSTNVSDTRDELKTFVNLAGFTSSKMTFYRAYGQTFTAPNIDTLEIRVSTNCGTSSTQVYYKGGSQIATGNGDAVTIYVPTAGQWVKDSIDLTPYVGNANVMVSIINRSHYGDGMYLDNINITGVTSSAPTATINSVSTACTGQSIALTNTTTGSPTSYTWTTTGGVPVSATTQTMSVSYATAGVKTISLTVANASGTVTVSKTITITATPVVTLTPTSTTICAGQTVTLTASGATTYTWLPTGSGTSSAVSPTSTTVYTVTGTTSGCISTSKMATVNVTAIPVVTITPTSTTSCAGQTRTLTASGATTYTWLPSGSGSTNIVSPTGTTVYTVTGTTAGCVSATKTATITVTSVPVITVTPTSTTICSGKSTTLTASGATTYTWIPASTGATKIVSPTGTTVYTVTGSVGSCNSTPKNATVTVVASPTLTASSNNTLICTGYTSTLTVTGNASSYTWSPAASLSSSTGTMVAASPTATTIYTVTATLGACTSTTSVTQNVSLCTGIANVVSSDEVNVFPNPSNGVFTLAYGSNVDEVNVIVINALGQTIKAETAKNISELSIDLTKMSKGVYYLKASTKDGSKLFKLILE
jgi:PKD repeat protein